MRIDILFMLILINLSELQSFVRYKCSCLIEWKLKQDLEVGGHYHVTNVSLSTNFLCESHDLEKPNFMWPKKSGEINLVFQKKVSWRREWVEIGHRTNEYFYNKLQVTLVNHCFNYPWTREMMKTTNAEGKTQIQP